MEYNKIIDEIQNIVNSRLCTIIDEISQDFNLNSESLKNKYILSGISKRRGRKKKTKDKFIETSPYTFNNNTYLVDNDNNVYTYNPENPLLIGEKLINGNIKFIEGYLESESHNDE